MPADVINVEFGALRAASEALLAKARTLESNMDTLRQSLVPIQETWYASGSEAGDAARQSETRLRAAIADVTGIISQFSGKVNEAHDTQRALESRNTGLFA